MQFNPAVFAVKDEYQILVPVSEPSLMWVRVGDACYYDHAAGVLRSDCSMHRMVVPMAALDAARTYTICERRIPHRKPYFSHPKPVVETRFAFSPVPRENARAYMIADAHNRVQEPIRAAQVFGNFDFLIFNGDVPEYSETYDSLLTVFRLNDALTGGTKPLLYTRGNHDLRGKFAESYASYTPNDDGRFFYPFRLGSLAGVILDCAEDKPDDHEEYGGTLCCSVYRQMQTRFLEQLDPASFSGAETRLVIVHSPFTHQFDPPFDIEKQTFARWSALVREKLDPALMLCGHTHSMGVYSPGSTFDHYGQPCTLVLGSKPGKGYFAGAGFTFRTDAIDVTFTDSDGKTLLTHTVERE